MGSSLVCFAKITIAFDTHAIFVKFFLERFCLPIFTGWVHFCAYATIHALANHTMIYSRVNFLHRIFHELPYLPRFLTCTAAKTLARNIDERLRIEVEIMVVLSALRQNPSWIEVWVVLDVFFEYSHELQSNAFNIFLLVAVNTLAMNERQEIRMSYQMHPNKLHEVFQRKMKLHQLDL